MSIGFTVIDDATAVMYRKGVFRQVSLYERNGNIYAASGSGFVKLKYSGATSDPNLKWDEIDGVDGAEIDIHNGRYMEYKNESK